MGSAAGTDLLARGELFGSPSAALHVAEMTLTETRYAPESRLPVHAHELPMFVFVVAGSFDERFGHHTRTCAPRRVIFRPAGERHAQHFLSRGSACLTIELPALGDDLSLAGADGQLDLAGVPALWAMKIYDEFRRPAGDTPIAIEEALLHLVSAAGGRRMPMERRAPRWLNTVRELIDERIAQNPSIRLVDLARSIGVHRVHLSRTFIRFLGCSVAEDVRRARVHAVCARIRNSRDSLSSIAMACGFSDESHMGRVFRDVMECSPGTYRSRLGATGNSADRLSSPARLPHRREELFPERSDRRVVAPSQRVL